jgi:hypothetical protein
VLDDTVFTDGLTGEAGDTVHSGVL